LIECRAFTFSFWRQKEKGNKKKKRRLKTEAGIFIEFVTTRYNTLVKG